MVQTIRPETESPTPQRIAAERRRLGLTQKQAGEIVLAPLRTWQDWEYGHRRMSSGYWQLFRIKTHPYWKISLEQCLLGDYNQ